MSGSPKVTKRLYPVMILTGSEEFLVNREKNRMIQAAWANGYRVIYASNQKELDEETSSAEILGLEKLLAITRFWPDLETLELDRPNTSYLIILEGDKLPEMTEIIARKAKTVIFAKPVTRRDKQKAAENFCMVEARLLGHPLANPSTGAAGANPLAKAIVRLVGDDFGMLSWDLSKAGLLIRANNPDWQKTPEITQEIIAQVIRPAVLTPDLSALTEALGHRDCYAMNKILARSWRSDPTMLILRAKGGPADAVMLWLRIAALPGLQDLDQLAERLGTPSWQLKNRDLPSVRKWGYSKLRVLLRSLANLERAILEGRCSNPWLACQTVLLQSVSVSIEGHHVTYRVSQNQHSEQPTG